MYTRGTPYLQSFTNIYSYNVVSVINVEHFCLISFVFNNLDIGIITLVTMLNTIHYIIYYIEYISIYIYYIYYNLFVIRLFICIYLYVYAQ